MSVGLARLALGQGTCIEHHLNGNATCVIHESDCTQSLEVCVVQNKVLDGVGNQ